VKYVEAGSAWCTWLELDELVRQRKGAGTIADRRASLMTLDSAEQRHDGFAELQERGVTMMAATLVVSRPPVAGDPARSAKTHPELQPVIGGAIVVSTAMPPLPRPSVGVAAPLDVAINEMRAALVRLQGRGESGGVDGRVGAIELRAAWALAARTIHNADGVRGNLRMTFGFSETACSEASGFDGLPQEPTSEGGMWYPRRNSQQRGAGSQLLERVLPLLSLAMRMVGELPIGGAGECPLNADLQENVGGLHFPHRVSVDGDAGVARADVKDHALALSCMHRLSIAVAEGDDANDAIAAILPQMTPASVRRCVNQCAWSRVHADVRDCGRGGEMFTHLSARRAGHDVVGCRFSRRAPGTPAPTELLQLVFVISYGCSDSEGLAIVGLRCGDANILLKSPAECGGIRVHVYLCDFSFRHHSNPMGQRAAPDEGPPRLPPSAWAIRVTPYATTHGATWWGRIAKLDAAHRAAVLKSFYQLDGYKPLGRDGHSVETLRAGLHATDAPGNPKSVGACVRLSAVVAERPTHSELSGSQGGRVAPAAAFECEQRAMRLRSRLVPCVEYEPPGVAPPDAAAAAILTSLSHAAAAAAGPANPRVIAAAPHAAHRAAVLDPDSTGLSDARYAWHGARSLVCGCVFSLNPLLCYPPTFLGRGDARIERRRFACFVTF